MSKWKFFERSSARETFKDKDGNIKDIYISSNSTYYYNKLEELHRADGPAVKERYIVGYKKEYWFNGQSFDCKNLKEFRQLLKLKAFL